MGHPRGKFGGKYRDDEEVGARERAVCRGAGEEGRFGDWGSDLVE